MEAHNDIGLLDKSKLLEIFDYLNQQLKENAMQLELTVYGGCIMTMVYDNRPATKDIDCMFSLANDKLLENILKNTQFVFDLSDGWINDEIKEPLKSIITEELETFKTYSNLKILKPKAKQLLELLASKDEAFLESLVVPLEIAALDEAERHYLTIIFAIIDHQLQLAKLDVPNWIRAEAFCFDQPYFHSKRLSDFEKVKIQYTVPGPFRARNVYIDPDGLMRV